ncbi:histidinol-phosphate transaminase [Rhabdobacter roseus]|uniref:Histidinol-phosphate aminotransferase n=1 Tax=Rhabdobacter roseus TaxID=1655419 RepID=A0A840TZI3_9BACT|nr:aminotransferase class I/II-fold pyridoxal phosphate-dependent enzyme [Rhabdobacter roseus]MBB5285310.1 histidinol-phosphate aminotransferase [Rhabdobacter roseus]
MTTFNRRNWLRSAAALTAGVAVTDFWRPAEAAEVGLPHLAGMAIKARLSSNENPHGPSPKAQKVIAAAIPSSYMYHRESSMKLRKLIAAENGLTEDHVILGAGSGELLVATALCYAMKGGPKSHIVGGDLTYMQLISAAKKVGVDFKGVPLTADLDYNLNAMLSAIDGSTSLVYLCNPNNPTGIPVDSAQLAAFCQTATKQKPVFIDEAYIDYVSDPKTATMTECIRKGQDVIIARTFSKVHGFAGLRVGYLLAKPEIVNTIRNFYAGGGGICATSIQGAVVSYQDADFMKYSLQKTEEAKQYLYALLKSKGYTPIPSSTNFVLFPLKSDGRAFVGEMAKQGVSIKHWDYRGQSYCRVSLGTMEEMRYFGDAFQKIAV